VFSEEDMLGVFGEFETNLRKERQMEGIAKAREKGPIFLIKWCQIGAKVDPIQRNTSTIHNIIIAAGVTQLDMSVYHLKKLISNETGFNCYFLSLLRL